MIIILIPPTIAEIVVVSLSPNNTTSFGCKKLYDQLYDKLYMSLYCLFILLFGENPQAVAYSAQPLCWIDCWTSSPTTHRGAVRKRWSRNTLRVVTARLFYVIIFTYIRFVIINIDWWVATITHLIRAERISQLGTDNGLKYTIY